MTPDLERAAKTMHPSAFRGQMAVNFNAEQLTFALRALETLSPEVVEAMADARDAFDNDHYIDGEHAWHYVRRYSDKGPLTVWGPGEKDDARDWLWRGSQLAAHRAMIKAVIGEAP